MILDLSMSLHANYYIFYFFIIKVFHLYIFYRFLRCPECVFATINNNRSSYNNSSYFDFGAGNILCVLFFILLGLYFLYIGKYECS